MDLHRRETICDSGNPRSSEATLPGFSSFWSHFIWVQLFDDAFDTFDR